MTPSSCVRRIAVDPVISLSPRQLGRLCNRFEVFQGWPQKKSIEGLLIHDKVTAQFLKNIEGLKWVAVRANNTDYAPSLPHIQKFGIPSLGAYAVAEHTFALILALKKQLVQADSNVKQRIWRKNLSLNGDLKGATLGIVGCGTIGTQVREIARIFGMQVLIATSPRKSSWGTLPLAEILRRSDILTIHLPGGGNDSLLGDPEIRLMQPHAIVINTSRGNVIDEKALKLALDEGRLAGAGLDVFQEEPAIQEVDGLACHPRVLATPHMGFQTALTIEQMTDALIQTVLNTIH